MILHIWLVCHKTWKLHMLLMWTSFLFANWVAFYIMGIINIIISLSILLSQNLIIDLLWKHLTWYYTIRIYMWLFIILIMIIWASLIPAIMIAICCDIVCFHMTIMCSILAIFVVICHVKILIMSTKIMHIVISTYTLHTRCSFYFFHSQLTTSRGWLILKKGRMMRL